MSALVERTKQALASGDIVEVHNAYVTYLAMALMSATGHRPVIDPFCHREWFDRESGTCLICDKVVSERHRYRLSWLAPQNCDALAAYERHLHALSIRLAERVDPHGWVADQIGRLLSGQAPAIPYLFYLGQTGTFSLSPKTLKHALGDAWPFELNVGRRVLAVGLREQGVARCHIAALLGHLDTLEHPFGPTGTDSPQSVGESLRPALARLVTAQNWQILEGLSDTARSGRVHAFGANTAGFWHEAPLLGPQQREANRREQARADLAAVRLLVHELTDTASVEEVDGKRVMVVDQARVDLIQERILADAKGRADVARRRLAVLAGELARLRRTGFSLRLPARMMVLEAEPSPFKADVLLRATQFRALRTGLLRWFCDPQARAELLVGRAARTVRIAEICISAAGFGGLAEKTRLRALARTLTTALPMALNGVVFVELARPEEDRPLWRWFPDPLSAGLLAGLRVLPPDSEVPSEAALGAALRALLQAIGIPPDKDPWRILVQLSAAGWQQCAPPFLAATVTGQTPVQPLGLSAWARLMTGKRLAPLPGRESDAQASAPVGAGATFGLIGRGRSRGELSAGETDRLVAGIQTAISEAMRAEPRGTQARSGSIRTRIRKALIAFARTQPALPVAAGMLLEWGIDLEQHGTRFKPILKPRTIQDYLGVLARPLLEVAQVRDLLLFGACEFEDLYGRILDRAATGKRRHFMAGRCAEFHWFCVRTWGVEEVDPAVFGGAAVEQLVNANLLTPLEYERALRLLRGDKVVPQRTQVQHVAILVLGYRFGLRIGESMRLLARDVFYEDGRPVCLEVRGDVFGDPKSPAGGRLVPLVGELNGIESEVLNRMRVWGMDGLREDLQAPYFQAAPGSRDRMPVDDALQRVHLALRTVTGDDAMRYHHLRRSWVQRVVIAVIGRLDGVEPWNAYHAALDFPGTAAEDVRYLLSGRREFNTASLLALTLAVGHSSVQTTLGNYVHILDALPGGERPPTDCGLVDRDVAYILGRNESAVRKQRTRLGIPVGEAIRLLWSEARARGVPDPGIRLRAHPESETLPARGELPLRGDGPSLESLDRLLCAAAQDNDVELLARSQTMSVHDVQRILQVAAEIEHETGYRLYALYRIVDRWTGQPRKPTLPPDSDAVDIEVIPETARLRSFLRKRPTRPDSTGRLSSMARAWMRAYAASGVAAGLRFTDEPSYDAFLGGLDILGLGCDWCHVVDQAPERRSGHAAPKHSSDHVRLLNLKSGAPGLSYQRTLDRYLYLVALWTLTGQGDGNDGNADW